MTICPFCKRDPYHYVDVGVGMVPAAIDCCHLGIDLFQYGTKEARQTLNNMRSRSPRRKAKAMKVLREYDLRPQPKGRAGAEIDKSMR